jgi:hypothetical protein
VRVPRHFRPEKAIDKDVGRPELLQANLVTEEEILEATDRHIVVRVPVEIEEGDLPGAVTADALAASRKGSESISCYEDALVTDNASFKRPRPDQPFPDLRSLIPGDEQIVWSFGLNAKLLLRLAQAMGTEEIVLEFTAVGSIADKLCPIRVSPLGKRSQGAVGLMMPVRTGEVNFGGLEPESTDESP